MGKQTVDTETGEIVAEHDGLPAAAGLVGAVNQVMAAVGYIQETGRNPQQNYSYASDEDLLKKVQPAMAAAGLLLAPVGVEWSAIDGETQKGGAVTTITAVVTYRAVHTSGESLDVVVLAQGQDFGGDKAGYKVMTGAYKYAVRQLFAIPTGKDAEADSGQPMQRTTRPPAERVDPEPAPEQWVGKPEVDEAVAVIDTVVDEGSAASAKEWLLVHPLGAALKATPEVKSAMSRAAKRVAGK